MKDERQAEQPDKMEFIIEAQRLVEKFARFSCEDKLWRVSPYVVQERCKQCRQVCQRKKGYDVHEFDIWGMDIVDGPLDIQYDCRPISSYVTDTVARQMWIDDASRKRPTPAWFSSRDAAEQARKILEDNLQPTLTEQVVKLQSEIDEWKSASGLIIGGDPALVTPAMLMEDIATRERDISTLLELVQFLQGTSYLPYSYEKTLVAVKDIKARYENR